MDLKRSWPARHPLVSGYLVFVVFVIAGIILHWSLYVPGILVVIGVWVFERKWIWICSKCKTEDWRREKYCRLCGGEMQLGRAKVRVKYCENGHRIEDHSDIIKMCPKCGGKILSERIELK